MLYGRRFVYGGENPFAPTKIRMGSRPISIRGLSVSNDGLVVEGNGFTKWSVVCANGEQLETEYYDEHTLLAPGVSPASGTVVRVAQEGEDKTVLSYSKGVVLWK
jgi:hypothetical protein